MKKKITILFSGAHLAYSPTVIGLYDLLSEKFDVVIVAENPEAFDFERLTNRNVIYKEKLTGKNRLRFYRRVYDLRSIFDKEITALRRMRFDTDVIYDFTQTRKILAAGAPDFIVAVDFQNLLYAQVLKKNVEFLSLEIVPNDKFYNHCDFKNINSVVIQTKERYDHLFEDEKFKTFFIQNAPIYKEEAESNANRRGLVYCGTAWNPFGFYHCLEFLRAFPEYTLNVKGATPSEAKAKVKTDYGNLTTSGRLIFDSEYLDDAAVVGYLRQFKTGFCFYNFELEWINNFNYRSAPSGKMFKYMAAGVPVVGQDITGLKPVEEFDCGVLIKDLKPATIKKAVEKIEGNFSYYSQNCLKAAAHYSFDKTAKPFVDYLTAK
jgi:glycosyltransferase involved in cell wall biosynthesis